MKRVISFLFCVAAILSCNKDEKDLLLWHVSPGPGEAYSVNALSDTGFYACGKLNGTSYFVMYDKDRQQIFELMSGANGLFSSAWFDQDSYILAGSESRRMFLQRYYPDGTISWQRTMDGLYNVEFTDLFYAGNQTLVAVGSASADSLGTGDSGILFLKFDTAGNIIKRKDVTASGYIGARADFDSQGNIYLALTRQSDGSKSRAAVAKYNSDFNLLWETDLFNNPGFASAAFAVKRSGDRILVSGRTELPSSSGALLNSFIVSLDNSGNLSSGWSKKYPQADNEATALSIDKDGSLVILNKSCMLLNRLSVTDGSDVTVSRTFDVCNSSNTDAFGYSVKAMSDGNILIGGSLGGSFFVGIKSAQ